MSPATTPAQAAKPSRAPLIPRAMRRLGWRAWHLPLAILTAALGVYLTREAWADILQIARSDEESSYIFLVPVVAAWMGWVRRHRLRTCKPSGTIIGPMLIAAGWGLSVFGLDIGRQSLWHAGSVLLVVGCLLAVLGTGVLGRLLPAFAVLVFLIPVPGVVRLAVAQPLQTATAATAQAVLDAFGVPVERVANVVTINGIDVAVVEACNGLRMVFALLLVSYAFAFGMPLRTFARIAVIAASPIAAIACNVLRLVPTVVLYGYGSRPYADGFHSLSAWLMLPIAFLLLLAWLAALRWALVPVTRYALAYQ